MMIVAEIGGNHLGHFAKAVSLIDAAKDAGADAVKFQCFRPEQMAEAGKPIKDGPWAGRDLLDLYREIYTSREWFPHLFHYARRIGLVPFSSVFHPDDVDFLETLDCQIYKISSFELTDTNLIKRAANTGKSLIISTGMASRAEIFSAVVSAGMENLPRITLLKCTSAYPAAARDANLRAITLMRDVFGFPVGLSDHSLTTTIPVAATALGATVIEKHLILSRSDGGPDAGFSLEPAEFAQMVRAVRETLEALGEPRFGPTAGEAVSLQFRRPPGGKRGG